jgi:hypothetical protein
MGQGPTGIVFGAEQFSIPTVQVGSPNTAGHRSSSSKRGSAVHHVFIPENVLWYFDDCASDKRYRNIITEANGSRLRMPIAVCCADGAKVSSDQFKACENTPTQSFAGSLTTSVQTLTLSMLSHCSTMSFVQPSLRSSRSRKTKEKQRGATG